MQQKVLKIIQIKIVLQLFSPSSDIFNQRAFTFPSTLLRTLTNVEIFKVLLIMFYAFIFFHEITQNRK